MVVRRLLEGFRRIRVKIIFFCEIIKSKVQVILLYLARIYFINFILI